MTTQLKKLTESDVNVKVSIHIADEVEKTIQTAVANVNTINLAESLDFDAIDMDALNILDARTMQVVGWLKGGDDVEGFGIYEIKQVAHFIEKVGNDNYPSYTIPEYMYMYTEIMDRLEAE